MIDADPALRLPTDAEKAEEERLYLAVRTDLDLGAEALCAVAARAVWAAAAAASAADPASLSRYLSNPAQPKIALRASSESELAAMAEALGSRCGKAFAGGAFAAIGAAPSTRGALPSRLSRARLLGDSFGSTALLEEAAVPGAPVLFVGVRTDADIPLGKLAAQAGHAAWSALSADFGAAAAWAASGGAVLARAIDGEAEAESAFRLCASFGLRAHRIVDAGRTVFLRPTPTAIGCGPVFDPEAIARLSALPALDDRQRGRA